MTNKKKPYALKYRPDIDGLRAVAILPVIFFHSGMPGFTGGYVGVDVFFVISGFLITSLLVQDIDAGTFRFSNFWIRRARRILPALIVVMAVCLAVGWTLAFPDDFVKLAQSTLAQAVFASNLFFWSETGYFAAPADAQPLLHTWSLAIEEQYYLLFPLILVLLSRHLKHSRFRVIFGAALLSLGFSIFGAFDHPEAAFYSIHSRAWELLAGSLLALLAQQTADSNAQPTTFDKWLGGLGLSAIVFSVVGFSETTPFPGAAAMIPTTGAAAIIWANRHGATGVGVLLACPQLVWVGALSYSLYLWHWPTLVFAKTIFYPNLDGLQTAAAVGLSFLAAWLSYAYIETPIRRRALFRTGRTMTAAALIGLATLICGSAIIWSADGIRSRFSVDINAILDARTWPADLYGCAGLIMEPCPLGATSSTGRVDFVLWGDSHAQALLPLIDSIARDSGVSGIYWGTPCPPIFGVTREKQVARCAKGNAALADILDKSTVRLIIVAARWSLYTEGFTRFELDTNESGTRYIADQHEVAGSRETANQIFDRYFAPSVQELADGTRHVAIVAEVPTHEFDPVDCLIRSRTVLHRCSTPRDQIRERQLFIDRQLTALGDMDGVAVVRPVNTLCDAARCPTWIDGRAVYKDDDHLSLEGAMLLKPLLKPMFTDLRNNLSNPKLNGSLE